MQFGARRSKDPPGEVNPGGRARCCELDWRAVPSIKAEAFVRNTGVGGDKASFRGASRILEEEPARGWDALRLWCSCGREVGLARAPVGRTSSVLGFGVDGVLEMFGAAQVDKCA